MSSDKLLHHLLLASFSDSGGPGSVMVALEIALREQGLQIQRLSRIKKSLWEAPFQNPSLAVQALLDKFLIKSPRFASPISMLREAPKSLIEVKTNYDYAILAWLPGLLTLADFRSLSETPTIIRVPDENPYTAICHYTSGCNRYASGCERCPAVRRFASHRVPLELKKKIYSYETLNRKAFVCPSNWIATRAHESLALRNESIKIIRNPIASSFFYEPESGNRAKKFTVLFVASQVFDPLKGFDSLAPKLDKLAESGKFEIRVVGNHGNLTGRFPSIQFLGRLNARELSEEYKKAWVTIVPSKSEASGNVVGESLASGTPVLVRNIDGLGEVAGQVSEDLLFDTDEELFEKLFYVDFKEFFNSREELIQVGQQHNPRIVANQYLKLLNSL